MYEDNDLMKTEGDINLSVERERWQEVNIDEETFALLAEDARYFLHQSLSTPCLNVIEKSYGIYIEDITGKRYMDFHGNSVHQVGYGNQAVINAVKEQLDVLPFSPRRYTNKTAIELAKKLAQLAPGNLNRVLFAPGGTSVVSMALKLVRKVTGKFKTISMWDAFHGASLDAISIGGEAVFKKDMGPLLPGNVHVMPYQSYRGFFHNEPGQFKELDYMEYVLEREQDIGAIIMEPIRCTDVQIPPEGYFEKLNQIREKYKCLIVFDEIPTALGRTGEMFAFENYAIIPDIVLLGKGLGGGIFPMAAMIVGDHLADVNDISLGHFTHEKSSLGCAAALATIQYIEDNQLLDKTKELGSHMMKRLMVMMEQYAIIGDVRGIGLLFAIELVKCRDTKEKAVSEAEKVMYHCMDQGLSFKVSQGNVLSLTPPLTISVEELDTALDMIEKALQKVS